MGIQSQIDMINNLVTHLNTFTTIPTYIPPDFGLIWDYSVVIQAALKTPGMILNFTFTDPTMVQPY